MDYTRLPVNTAALAGDEAVLSCISDSSDSLHWYFSPTGQPPLSTIVNSCALNPAFADKYSLRNIGTGQCDLVVLSAARDLAGIYACQALFEGAPTAQLVVVASDPVCSVDNLDPTGGENVSLTCEVLYTSNLSPMLMSWTDSEGQPVESRTVHGDGITTSYLVVRATTPMVPSYTCKTNFSVPINPPSSASNAPQYDYSWVSPVLTVKGELLVPMNTAALSGTTVTLYCRRQTQRILWGFVSASGAASVSIVVDCQVLPAVSEIYKTDSSDDSCNLIINSLAMNLAGTYSCQDMMSSEPVASAEVITLESDPDCSSTASTNDFVLFNSIVLFSCKLSYSGNIHPSVTWKDEFGNIVPSDDLRNSTHIENVMTVQARPPSLRPYTSSVFFNAPTVDPPAHLRPALNRPSYTYNWTSLPKQVLHDDCSEILRYSPGIASGVFNISVSGINQAVQVYCDMFTTGGGWTVFQRRADGSHIFFRHWADYADGFGITNREFWIGNDILAALTAGKQYRLRVDLGDRSDNSAFAEYTSFRVGHADTKYTLSELGSYSGNAGDSFGYHRGMMFTTYDQDNDNAEYNCADWFRGAWWYDRCLQSNLNGEYNNTYFGEGVVWNTWLGAYYSLGFTEMKLRPINFN